MGLGSRRERRNRPCARVREKNVDVPMLLLHGRVEPIQIFQARYVAYDRRNVSSDEGCGRLQLFISSPGDHDMRAFFHEALGRGQPEIGRASCRERVCQYVLITGVALQLNKKKIITKQEQTN